MFISRKARKAKVYDCCVGSASVNYSLLYPALFRTSPYSPMCLRRALSLLFKFYKSTSDICHISGSNPVDMTQIVASLLSVCPACQMASGPQSPDIHQCLAVRCSLSSALTQQTSLFCSSMGATWVWSNDATKWGAIAWDQMEFWPTALPYSGVILPPPVWCGEFISWTAINVCANSDMLNPCIQVFSRLVQTPISNYTCSQLPLSFS